MTISRLGNDIIALRKDPHFKPVRSRDSKPSAISKALEPKVWLATGKPAVEYQPASQPSSTFLGVEPECEPPEVQLDFDSWSHQALPWWGVALPSDEWTRQVDKADVEAMKDGQHLPINRLLGSTRCL
eukprot:Skav218892  [mRNA]  locus=scaffold328:171722:172105:+ [translate_table: standard]